MGMCVCILECRCQLLSLFMGMCFRGMSHQSPAADSQTPSAASGSGRRRQAVAPLANQKLWRANGEFVRVLWPARLTVAHAFPTKGYPGDYDSVIKGASDRGIFFTLRSRQRKRSAGGVVKPAVLIITGPHGCVMQFYDELRSAVGAHLGGFMGLPAASRIVLRELTAVAIGDVLPTPEEPDEAQPEGPPVDELDEVPPQCTDPDVLSEASEDELEGRSAAEVDNWRVMADAGEVDPAAQWSPATGGVREHPAARDSVDIDMQRLRELGENAAKALKVLYTKLKNEYMLFGNT